MHYLIATHGTLASGFTSALAVLLGSSENIHTIDCYVDVSNPRQTIQETIDAIGDAPLLMFSDLVGGSVNQILNEYCDRPNTFQISGCNLAIMIEIMAQNKDDWTKDELKATVEACKASMQLIDLESSDDVSSDDFF